MPSHQHVPSVAALLPRPEDELLHEPVGDDTMPWKDTYYLSICDERSRVHIAMHMTVNANRTPRIRVAVGAKALGRDSVIVRREDGYADEQRIGNSLGSIEALNLSWDEQHRLRWHCAAPDFEFDVVVAGVHLAPYFDILFPGANPTGKQGHSYSHTEQVIRGSGTFRWRDGQSAEVEGMGWRDRGWGRRKNVASFGTGYDVIAGILPDGSAFSFSAMRNVEHAPDAPIPAYGFLSDTSSIAAAVAGHYHKDSMSFPAAVDLEFGDGRRAVGRTVRRVSTLGTPFHDADPAGAGVAVGARDYYVVMADYDGVEFPVWSNEGHGMRCDVTRGARFFYDEAFRATGSRSADPESSFSE